MKRTHAWEDVVDDEIRALAANYAGRMGMRDRPALLCIDNYNAVYGDRREPLLEGMKRFPSSCGPSAWDAIEPTQRLLAAARAAGIPVIYTTRDDINQSAASVTQSTKRVNYGGETAWNHAIFSAFTPEPGELVIHKPRASAFYGTPLGAHLVQLDVNSLVICGESTSGCVRSTVIEAYMLGYNLSVVEECVFDRNWLSHKVNLFDINCKYGDVLFLDEALEYIDGVGERRSAKRNGVPALVG